MIVIQLPISYQVHNEHCLSEYKFINHKYMKACHCAAVCHDLVRMGGVTAKHLDQLRSISYDLLSMFPNEQ